MKDKKQTVTEKGGDGKDEDDTVELGWGIARFNHNYQEAIMKLPPGDEHSFWVHDRLVRFSKNSLGVLENKTKFRWSLVWLTTSKAFDRFIITLIMLNSLFLAIKDYTDVDNKTEIN